MTTQQINKMRTSKNEGLYDIGYTSTFNNEEVKMAYGLMMDCCEDWGCDDAEAGYVNEAGQFVSVVALADEALLAEYENDSSLFAGAYIIDGYEYDDYEYDENDYVDAEMEAQIIAERDEKDDSAWIAATYC